MFKRIMKWLAPKLIDILTKGLQDWADDPNTKTDNKAIKAVGDYISYMTVKWLS